MTKLIMANILCKYHMICRHVEKSLKYIETIVSFTSAVPDLNLLTQQELYYLNKIKLIICSLSFIGIHSIINNIWWVSYQELLRITILTQQAFCRPCINSEFMYLSTNHI